MKWSWRIGRVAGIDIRIHATFSILLGWIVFTHFGDGQTLAATVRAGLFVITVFGMVVLHEFGHALMARRFGVRTREIVLLPIGGVARLDRVPTDPTQELLIAIAGPLVNVLLAGVILLLMAVAQGTAEIFRLQMGSQDFFSNLLWANVMLAIFNMLPAFPMDGGRVLRALLASRIDYVRATEIAARIGKVAGWVFGFFGILGNPFLVFVGLFVWMGADAEASLVRSRHVLTQLPLKVVMKRNPQILKQSDTLGFAAEQVFQTGCSEFLVSDGDRIVGLLTVDDVEAGLAKLGEQGQVRHVASGGIQFCSPTDPAGSIVERLTDKTCPAVVVFENDRIVGLVTASQIFNYLRLHSAVVRTKRNRRRGLFGSGPHSWAEDHAFLLRN